ncbi:MFS transporter [Caballeronia ptereochthonis]|uniref:General substrate transporter n=1 Tax=Caballeronia ptereochthonis TaxID=1777144 RepID=A0A157ZFK8_9BURK|nr:MFS transporter [Caballeronia ptereochthonis]SAK43687.1 general substrate transporter [Caballeronia ptereochthonis]
MTDRAHAVANPYAAGDSPRVSSQSSRAVTAAVVGNILEWFDFGTYAFLATVIAKVMFPAGDDFAAMLGTFGAFGLGFAARPLGAIVFGWLGDKKGRKWTLTFVMPLMAAATLFMALLPSYASIGIMAPVLLIAARMLQGISVGGELGNAVAFLVEWAPPNKRGFYGSFQQCSTLGGMLLGSGAAALMTTLLSPQAMLDWGWRVPFVVGAIVIGPIGWIIRKRSEETPVYQHANDEAPKAKGRAPALLGLQACGLVIVWTVSLYVLLNYLPSFTTKYVGMNASTALWLNTAGLIVMTVSIPFWGAASDHFGRKPVYAIGCIAFLVLPYPIFHLMLEYKSAAIVGAVQLLGGVIIGIFSGVGPAVLSELFPTKIRTTWMSIGYGIANAVFGGFAPMISIALIKATGSPLSPAYFVMLAALLSTITVATIRETAHDPLQ